MIDLLVGSVLEALDEYAAFTRERIDHIVKKASVAALDERALVCVPTSSGTGAEVTPFAVITDTATGKFPPAAAVEARRDAVGIERGFQDLGVDEDDFLAEFPRQARRCAPAGPRMPMPDDMQALMRAAYYGKE